MSIIGQHYARVLLRLEAKIIQREITPTTLVDASYAEVYLATMKWPWHATLKGAMMTIHGATLTFIVQLKSPKGA